MNTSAFNTNSNSLILNDKQQIERKTTSNKSSKRSLKIFDLISTSEASNSSNASSTEDLIVLTNLTPVNCSALTNENDSNSSVGSGSNGDVVKKVSKNKTGQDLISRMKPLEKDKDSNRMIRDIAARVDDSSISLENNIASPVLPVNQINHKPVNNVSLQNSLAVRFESIEGKQKYFFLLKHLSPYLKKIFFHRWDQNTVSSRALQRIQILVFA